MKVWKRGNNVSRFYRYEIGSSSLRWAEQICLREDLLLTRQEFTSIPWCVFLNKYGRLRKKKHWCNDAPSFLLSFSSFIEFVFVSHFNIFVIFVVYPRSPGICVTSHRCEGFDISSLWKRLDFVGLFFKEWSDPSA